jgi:hypothetical protein
VSRLGGQQAAAAAAGGGIVTGAGNMCWMLVFGWCWSVMAAICCALVVAEKGTQCSMFGGIG